MAGPRSDRRGLARARAAAQLLARPTDVRHPADVARLAGPIQAQEPRAAKLAFRARGRGLTAADVDAARTEERSLLRAWMMRKTVHLVPAEDAGWIVPLFAPIIVRWSRKRLADFGLDSNAQDRALAPALRRRRGRPPDPDRAGRAARARGVRSRSGVQGPPVAAGDPRRRALSRPRPRRSDVPRTHARLARRARGALARGLARRARPPLHPRVRAGVRARPRTLGGAAAARLPARARADRLRAARAARRRRGPPGDPRCSPALALAGRPPAGRVRQLQPRLREPRLRRLGGGRQRILPGGGIVRPTVTVDGRFVGTWSSRRSGRRLAVTIEPFTPLGAEIERAVAAEVDDIGRFEGLDATLA